MEKKEIVRKGYNKTAEILEEIFGVERTDNEQIEFLTDFSSRIPKNGRILDAGCGNGAYSRILSGEFEVIGVDISEKQIGLAKKNALEAQFICEDMTKLTFSDQYFDGILSYYAVIHVPREEQYDLLRNFHRMLKSDGVLLITLQHMDDPESYYEDFFETGVKMFWSGFDKETNLKMIQDIGFKIIWSKLVLESPKFGDNYHLFVMAEK
jgi:2-polyprenyl-3-methyl-5-hydroxy-6-metoxy-1,4-benzoquinol methylase